MQIQLNEAELEVAVTLYLTNQGMNLKNKSLELTFEGECTMDIEAIETDTPVAPKPKQTRKKAAPKKVEPKEEPVEAPEPDEEPEATVAVEEVVEALNAQTEPESNDAEDLFPVQETPVEVVEEVSNDNSLFA